MKFVKLKKGSEKNLGTKSALNWVSKFLNTYDSNWKKITFPYLADYNYNSDNFMKLNDLFWHQFKPELKIKLYTLEKIICRVQSYGWTHIIFFEFQDL